MQNIPQKNLFCFISLICLQPFVQDCNLGIVIFFELYTRKVCKMFVYKWNMLNISLLFKKNTNLTGE